MRQDLQRRASTEVADLGPSALESYPVVGSVQDLGWKPIRIDTPHHGMRWINDSSESEGVTRVFDSGVIRNLNAPLRSALSPIFGAASIESFDIAGSAAVAEIADHGKLHAVRGGQRAKGTYAGANGFQ